jgi:D-alanyl-D-alanine dipeptidase
MKNSIIKQSNLNNSLKSQGTMSTEILIVILILVLSCSTVYASLQITQAIKPESKQISYPSAIPAVFTPENEYDLVNIIDLNTNISVEIRYASTDNFAGIQFYPYTAKAMLRKNTAEKLKNANEEFYKLGYRLKVFDAYRPYSYQQQLRDAAYNINTSWAPYLADPSRGSNHNRGTAVDITLTTLDGKELDMPTSFDYFGKEASISYNGCTEEQKKNRELLAEIMIKHGFNRINSEWWHFDDTEAANYEILDVTFNEL